MSRIRWVISTTGHGYNLVNLGVDKHKSNWAAFIDDDYL